MADSSWKRPAADSPDRTGANSEENIAQRQSDAVQDVVAEEQAGITETSDRAGGRGSTANGTPASDDADGEGRRQRYKKGAEIVSRID